MPRSGGPAEQNFCIYVKDAKNILYIFISMIRRTNVRVFIRGSIRSNQTFWLGENEPRVFDLKFFCTYQFKRIQNMKIGFGASRKKMVFIDCIRARTSIQIVTRHESWDVFMQTQTKIWISTKHSLSKTDFMNGEYEANIKIQSNSGKFGVGG